MTPASAEHDDQGDDGGQPGGVPDAPAGRQRVGDVVRPSGRLLAAEGVLHQARRPCPSAASAEADVEAPLLLQQAGEQRSDEGADVDAHVEQREAGVTALVVLVVQRADQRGGVGLDPAAAQRDQHQADPDPGEPGDQRQRDVPGHHRDGA